MSGFTDAAKHILGTVAPVFVDAFAGPFAPLANAALAKVFGLKPEDTAGLSAAVQKATPEQLLALKQEGDVFTAKMEELGITRDKMVFDDLANARALQVATKDPTVRQLAWLNVGGFLAIAVFLIVSAVVWPDQVSKIPATAWATLGTVFGYLAKSASQTEAFYFGSSAGSQAKDATLADLAKAP